MVGAHAHRMGVWSFIGLMGRGACAHEFLVGLHAHMSSFACSYYM